MEPKPLSFTNVLWKIDRNCCTYQILTSNQRLKCFILLSTFQLSFEPVDFLQKKRSNEHGLTFNLTYSPHCLLWHCASLLFQRMCRAQSSSDCRQLPIKVSTPQDSHQISGHVPGQRGSYGWIWRSAPKAVNAGAGRPASSLKLVFKDDVGLSWWFPDLGYIRSILKLIFWLFLICHIWDDMIHFNIGGLLN